MSDKELLLDFVNGVINKDSDSSEKAFQSYLTGRAKEMIQEAKEEKAKEKLVEKAFDVYKNGKLIDTVFYNYDDAEEVKKSLIDHDGYDSDIKVKVSESVITEEEKDAAGSARKNPLHKYIVKKDGKWALVSKHTGKVLKYYDGEGYPSEEWLDKQLKRIHSFESGKYGK